jgi:hypothetical protein
MRMLNDVAVIDVLWDGPFSIEKIATEAHNPYDHGVYQIYGTHAVLGPDTLLYVGQAEAQNFGQRVPQGHTDWIDWEPGAVQVYIGRLAGTDRMTESCYGEWAEMIGRAEALLIYFCSPPYNSSGIRRLRPFGPTLVLNFKRRHRLPLMVSNIYEMSPVTDPSFKPYY